MCLPPYWSLYDFYGLRVLISNRVGEALLVFMLVSFSVGAPVINSLGLARLTASEGRMNSPLPFSAFPGYGGHLGLAASLRGLCPRRDPFHLVPT